MTSSHHPQGARRQQLAPLLAPAIQRHGWLGEGKERLLEPARPAAPAVRAASAVSSCERAFAANRAVAQQHEPIAHPCGIGDLVNRQHQRAAVARERRAARAATSRVCRRSSPSNGSSARTIGRGVSKPERQQRALALALRQVTDALVEQRPELTTPRSRRRARPRRRRTSPATYSSAQPTGLRRPWRDAVGEVEERRRPGSADRARCSRVERQHAADAFEQRGLAGPVGADEAEDFPAAHLERHASRARSVP